MRGTDQTADHVLLADGVSVPLQALRFCWQLEHRGCQIRLDGEEIIVGPRALLTDDDRAGLKQWRDAIRAVVEYCERREARQ